MFGGMTAGRNLVHTCRYVRGYEWFERSLFQG